MTTLCGASRYQQKYYYNPDFAKIPRDVQQELKEICVGFVEDAGGVFTIDLDENGEPSFTVHSAGGDQAFDEIGAELRVRRLQKEKAELMKQIAVFYRVFILGEAGGL